MFCFALAFDVLFLNNQKGERDENSRFHQSHGLARSNFIAYAHVADLRTR